MPRAFDKAYRAVREGVIAGRFPPSHRITEQEVAEAAGVSRTPVREALRRLHAEGLVEFRPNQGAMVTSWSNDELDEIVEFRALFESHVARRAARRATTDQLASLRSIAEAQRSEVESQAAGYAQRVRDLDAQFDRTLQEAAGSARLSLALAPVLDVAPNSRSSGKLTDEQLREGAAHHLEVVRALEGRSPDWAAAAITSHLLSARPLSPR